MTRLDDLMGDEFKTPEALLAQELSSEHQHLLAELVAIRVRRRISQDDMARALGLTQATISAFERIGNDPHLSTVRRYARALGVMIRHHIDEGGLACGDSHYLTHVTNAGLQSRDTAAAATRRLLKQTGMEWPDEKLGAPTSSRPRPKVDA